MSEEDMKSVFKFSGANEDKTSKQGVSLPIVKKIVEAHGGEILLESKFGGGSTFTVNIPIVDDI